MNYLRINIIYHLLGFLLIFLFACEDSPKKTEKETVIFCNAEKVDLRQNILKTSQRDFVSLNGKLQSDEYALSGKYSIKTNNENPVGFVVEVSDFNQDEYFFVEVWRLGNSNGFIQVKDSASEFLILKSEKVLEQMNSWEKLILEFTIPPNFKQGKFSISTVCFDSVDCYFDDLKILRKPKIEYPLFTENVVQLNIGKADLNQLEKIRNEMFSADADIEKLENNWVDVEIEYNNKKYEGNLRLFAPELEYLKDKKWGYELELKKGAINNGRSFRLYHPELTQQFNKVYANRILNNEEILVQKVFCLPVSLNDESRGLYIFEEKMNPDVNKRKAKPKGELVQFHHKIKDKKELKSNFPFLETANIEVIRNEENTRIQEEFAINNLAQLLNDTLDLNRILNLYKTAKYLALMDVLFPEKEFHLLNQVFYFDYYSFKIFPVGLKSDYFISDDSIINLPTGMLKEENFKKKTAHNSFKRRLFSNKTFLKSYKRYLYRYSNPSYWSKFMINNENELKHIDSLYQKEFFVSPDVSFLLENSQRLKSNLKHFETYLDTIDKFDEKIAQINTDTVYPFDTAYPISLAGSLTKHYLQAETKDSLYYIFENWNSYPIELIGTSTKIDLPMNRFSDTEIVSSFKSDTINEISFEVNHFAKYLHIKVPGKDSILILEINRNKETKYWSPHFELTKNFMYERNDSIRILRKSVIQFRSREYIISQPLIIPRGYTVKFEPGCKIDFVNNAFILSYSPVLMRGIKSKPVEFSSSDKTGQGLVVYNTQKGSYVKDIVYSGVSSFNYKGWTFPASFNFYKSNTEIVYSSFTNINGCDAVSSLQSSMNIRFCHFDEIEKNALNAYNSNTNIYKTIFNHIEGNAVASSSSNLYIEDSEIENCKGIGILGKYGSKIELRSSQIYNSNTAIISSDNSKIYLNDVSINNCKLGFVAFQNSSLFGPSIINTNLTLVNETKRDFLIEKESILIYNDDTITANESNVATLFYTLD